MHRDIKLDNILVFEDGKHTIYRFSTIGTVKLGDFTVAKKLNSDDEIVYDSEGTPFFTGYFVG